MKSTSELPGHWQIWYQELCSIVPENENIKRLRGELLGKLGSQQYSAAFELFLFSLFKKIGLNVEFQPEINGINSDFHISDMRGCGAYVEAGVMFSDPFATELSYQNIGMPLWEEFKKIQSEAFSIEFADSSGHPGNVSPKSVRREVQKWVDQQNPAKLLDEHSLEYREYHHYNIPPTKKFYFGKWELNVALKLKSPEDKERLGKTAVELAGFSGSWVDNPANRLKSKLKEKFSQVTKTKSQCIVAITERTQSFSTDDVHEVLFGGNCEVDMRPHVEGLYIPQLKTDGLWSSHKTKQPIAVIIHKGNLLYPDSGTTELWLNPNGSYFGVPHPLFSLSICAVEQKTWTMPAAGSY